jgi:hypothetical protein
MTRPAPLTKVCSICGRELPISDFYKLRGGRDGHRCQCRHCFTEKQSKKRVKDPNHKVKHRTELHPVMTKEQLEKKREYARKYREANRDRLNQLSRESNRRRRAGEEKRNPGPPKGITLTKQPFTQPKAQPKPSDKKKTVQVEKLCKQCVNWPCFDGIENLESDFAREGCHAFRTKKKQ